MKKTKRKNKMKINKRIGWSSSRYDYLLRGVEALTNPSYHVLNKEAGRNDRLLHAVLCAYAKHHLDCEDIGWNQLGDILHCAICNEIGDRTFINWGNTIKPN